MLPESRTD